MPACPGMTKNGVPRLKSSVFSYTLSSARARHQASNSAKEALAKSGSCPSSNRRTSAPSLSVNIAASPLASSTTNSPTSSAWSSPDITPDRLSVGIAGALAAAGGGEGACRRARARAGSMPARTRPSRTKARTAANAPSAPRSRPVGESRLSAFAVISANSRSLRARAKALFQLVQTPLEIAGLDGAHEDLDDAGELGRFTGRDRPFHRRGGDRRHRAAEIGDGARRRQI